MRSIVGRDAAIRLTCLRRRPNHRRIGWFPDRRFGSGVNGNVKGWTQAGHSYRSRPRDCRTVRVRHPGKPVFRTGRLTRPRNFQAQPEKPLESITISRGRTPLCLRIVHLFVMPVDCGHAIRRETSGKARRTRSRPEARGTVSQETCHPQGIVPDPGRDTPDASTEVVMASSSRSFSGRVRFFAFSCRGQALSFPTRL